MSGGATDIETIQLNLEGNYAAAALIAADATAKLTKAQEKAKAAGEGDIGAQKAVLRYEKAAKLAKKEAEAYDAARKPKPALLSAMDAEIKRQRQLTAEHILTRKAKEQIAAEDRKAKFSGGLLQAVDLGAWKKKLDSSTGGFLGKGAMLLGKSSEEIESMAPALNAASSGLAVAGGVVVAGAAALVAAGVAVAASLKAGYEYGLEKSAERRKDEAVFAHLGTQTGRHTARDIAYRYGLSESDTISQSKELMHSNFKESQLGDLFRASTGLNMLETGKGDQFISMISRFSRMGGEGKAGMADTRMLRGFAEAGVETGDIQKELAKAMHMTESQAAAKLNGHQVTRKQVVDAAIAAAVKDTGTLADSAANSLGASKNRVSMTWTQLWDNMDTSPATKFMNDLATELGGEGGKKINDGIKHVFDAINDTFLKPIDSEGGKSGLQLMIDGIGKSLDNLADGIRTVKPLIEFLFPNRGNASLAAWDSRPGALAADKKSEGGLDSMYRWVNKNLGDTGTEMIYGESVDKAAASGDATAKSMLTDKAGMTAAGADHGQGFIDGLTSKTGDLYAAAKAMIFGTEGAVRAAGQTHSPSKLFADVGEDMGAGINVGMDAQNDNAAEAGRRLVRSAAQGATSGVAMSSGSSGSSGGDVAINITNHNSFAAGTTAEQAAALGKANADSNYESWRRNMRAYRREISERAS